MQNALGKGLWGTAVAVTAAVAGLAAPPAAHADERVCRGTIGARSIDGDIKVPSGAICRLVGTRVEGNVKLYRGSTLIATKVVVGGNIQGDNSRRVSVTGSRVDGSIQLKSGRGSIQLSGNRVDSDVQLFSNRGPSAVSRNVIGGNLQCKSNVPKPTGSGNRVHGNKEDQCKRL